MVFAIIYITFMINSTKMFSDRDLSRSFKERLLKAKLKFVYEFYPSPPPPTLQKRKAA